MKKLAAIAALSAIAFTGCAAEDGETKQPPSASEKVSNQQTQSKEQPTQEEADEQDVPKEWQSALKKADGYANLQHMSKAGLFDQLTSEYGEQFSQEAAQYAVDNVETDWNENALSKARSYQEHQNMAPASIYEQLTSEYGEQFTPEEAQYAVDNL